MKIKSSDRIFLSVPQKKVLILNLALVLSLFTNTNMMVD